MTLRGREARGLSCLLPKRCRSALSTWANASVSRDVEKYMSLLLTDSLSRRRSLTKRCGRVATSERWDRFHLRNMSEMGLFDILRTTRTYLCKTGCIDTNPDKTDNNERQEGWAHCHRRRCYPRRSHRSIHSENLPLGQLPSPRSIVPLPFLCYASPHTSPIFTVPPQCILGVSSADSRIKSTYNSC